MGLTDPASSDLFRTVCGRFATGVTIATAHDATGGQWGLTVNSFASVSLDPPLVLFSIAKGAASHDAFAAADGYTVNILAEDQEALSNRFSLVKDVDRFNGVALANGLPGEAPILAGCLGAAVCDLEKAIPGGDHTILLGRVRRIVVGNGVRPLLYYRGGYGRII